MLRQSGPAVGVVAKALTQELPVGVAYAIRQLMWEACDENELDPDRLSFMRALRLVRRHTTDQAGLSPLGTEP